MNAEDRHEGEAPIPELTKRQQQVLDLLVRGYSNPQIAEALGISLDGAKWHVSEVMAKLGAESRQGAAERWRRHQRLGARVGRGLRALVPAALWAKVLVGGGTAAIVGAGIASAIVEANGGSVHGSPDTTTNGSAPLATHPADYLPPGNACAAIGYPPLHVSIESGGVYGVLNTAADTPLSGRWQLVFPEGFHLDQRNGARVVLSADGSIVIRDGEVIPNPAICLFDGKLYMDESISVTPAPG